MLRTRPSCALACAAVVAGAFSALAEPEPEVRYHLTAREWESSGLTRAVLLQRLESLARFAVRHQNADGAFVDPVLGREHQYATPYLAYSLATLIDAGRAPDLLNAAERATAHAVHQVALGHASIPDGHGEFFLAPLVGAVQMLEARVHEDQFYVWSDALSVSIERVIESRTAKINNWRTYAMKGEWLRARAGWIPRDDAVAFIEDAWLRRTQADRVLPTRFAMYRDWNGDPQSLAVEAVGRGNLLALIAEGYDGPSAPAIAEAVHRATGISLLLQDPSGQAPPNGRTDNHVFNDVLYGTIFTAESKRLRAAEDSRAGQYKRAAALALQSIERWKRTDDRWSGAYSITKNHLPVEDRVGYQPASQVGNYTGAVLYHLAEAIHLWDDGLVELPTPAEIGGYAIALDPAFGAAVLNAGGLQVFVNLRGDSVPKYGDYWTPLGIVRIARTNWDGRLGPSDGARTEAGSVALVPEWFSRGEWVRLPDMAEHYRGTLLPEFVHPLLVRARILYAPVTGVGGPAFTYELTLTPELVHVRVTSPSGTPFRQIVPVLENDGRALDVRPGTSIVATRYGEGGDEQTIIALGDETFEAGGDSVLSTYGTLKPFRLASDANGAVELLIYPRSPGDPSPEAVRDSFVRSGDGFETVLGTVSGTTYRGRTAAGGYAAAFDIDGDHRPDAEFSEFTGAVVKHEQGSIIRVETDRTIEGRVDGILHAFEAYTPTSP
jgi:hypothetical protein